jgi:hypothetical protein
MEIFINQDYRVKWEYNNFILFKNHHVSILLKWMICVQVYLNLIRLPILLCQTPQIGLFQIQSDQKYWYILDPEFQLSIRTFTIKK